MVIFQLSSLAWAPAEFYPGWANKGYGEWGQKSPTGSRDRAPEADDGL